MTDQHHARQPLRTSDSSRNVSGSSYHVFAAFYDAVEGERSEDAQYVQSLICKHQPRARTVLELACGTGAILEELQPHYEVAGLDLSKPMLAIAADKLPDVRLIADDMTSFRLGERFDVLFCVFDGINHLLEYRQWEGLFDRASEHLNDGGIFLVDLHTERQLERLTGLPTWTRWFGDGNLALMDVREDGGRVVVWSIRIFEHRGNDRFRLHSEEIRLVSFSRDQIEASLRHRFARVWTYDQRRTRPTSRSERLQFVCQAKPIRPTGRARAGHRRPAKQA